MAHPAPRRWYPITFTVAALVLLPLSVLLLSWLEIDREIWSHLWIPSCRACSATP